MTEAVNEVIRAEMFGGFEVYYAGKPVVTKDSRNSKVIQLLQYLLCNRSRMVLQDELINVILEDEETNNPIGTLKNLVYRLRKLLEEAGVPRDSIQYKKNAYGFNANMPCEIDAEEFMELAEKSNDLKLRDQEKLDICLKAIDLYKGGFLPRGSGEPWVMGFSVQYQEIYGRLFRIAYELVRKNDEYEKFVTRLQHAVALYPYEEDLAMMYIECLYRTKRIKEATDAYEAVSAILLNDLGIGPSEQMKALYKEITGGLQEVAESAADVRRKMAEEEYEKGAFYCNSEVFTNLYQFVVRHMERSGKSVFLILCTITGPDGAPPESGEHMKAVTRRFQEAVKLSLRRGDAYTRYSPSQFLLMLMEINQENCNIVTERLRAHFYKGSKMNQMRLVCKSISAADMDKVIENFSEPSDLSWA